MGRLIAADRLKEVFSRNVVGGNAYFDLIDNAPTVEAIPNFNNATNVEAIKVLKQFLQDYVEFWEEKNELAKALDIAIATMCKYQKIEQILKDIPYGGEATVRRIQEVVEDGNNN